MPKQRISQFLKPFAYDHAAFFTSLFHHYAWLFHDLINFTFRSILMRPETNHCCITPTK